MKSKVNSEIIQIIDSVVRDKGIAKAELLKAMEQAYQMAGRKKYGQEHHIRAEMDQNTGEINLFRVLKVVQTPENNFLEISLEDASSRQSGVNIDDEIVEKLPPIEIGRVSAQIAKQVIIQKVGEAERAKQYEDYKDRKGDIINGIVKRIEFSNIIVDLGRAEGILVKDQQIKNENYKVGDRIKAYVQDVRKEHKGPQIFLSRTDNQFLVKLFEIEVPEIYDNIIEIRAVAREPGSKAKIAVYVAETGIDPVGSCVGVKGNRVRSITNELSGEKIDIVVWDKNVAQYVINAMTPASISKIVFDQEKGRVEAIVPNDQLSIAVGKRGQNVRLASKITGWSIDVLTEEQESVKRSEEFENSTELFMKNLEVEEVIAQLLSAEGFSSNYQIASADDSTLLSIEGFEQELVSELKNRALNIIEKQNEQIIVQLEKLGVEQELVDLLELQPEYILKLAEFGIKTIEDLAEITYQEFREIVPEDIISREEINKLIELATNHTNG